MTEEFTTPQLIADEVTNYLRRQLLTGKKYPAGSFIREKELAEELHISRSPVRDALKALESDGIVRTFPRRGAMVLEYSPQEMEELYNIRILLEMEVYRSIVQKNLLTDEHYEWLLNCAGRFKSVHSVFEESHEKGQLGFFALDSEFHFYIHDIADLPWTADLLRKTYAQLYHFRIRHIGAADLNNLIQAHYAIIENLRIGDLTTLRKIREESYLIGRLAGAGLTRRSD